MLLKNVKVLEWAEGLSAPFGCRLLADLGAEVIKIERPGVGDSLRRTGPFWHEEMRPNDSALFNYVNAGKRSVTLDPDTASGADLLKQLASTSNLLVEAQAPGALERAGIPVAELQAANPALVVLSVTPFGQIGALRDAFSSDLTIQHYSTFAYNQTRPVKDPDTQPPIAGADREGPLSVGLAAAVAALSGLLMARTRQRGSHIDLASLDFYAAHVSPEPLSEWCDGERHFDRNRQEFNATEVAGGLIWIIRCADGWAMVSPREQHQWERWLTVLGNPEWAQDAALCGDRAARKRNYARVQELMSEWSIGRKKHDVFEAAQNARVACFPVNTPKDVLADTQLAHRKFFNTLRSSSGATMPMPGVSFKITTTDGEVLEGGRELSPLPLGEANDEVFRNRLNLSDRQLEVLRSQSVI